MQPKRAGEWRRIALVLLCAGRSARFGRSKLAEPLLGTPLIRRTAALFASLPFARRVAVIAPDLPGIADLGFEERMLPGRQPQSRSLAEGVGMIADDQLDGIMVALGDMPLVTARHLAAILDMFDGKAAVCSRNGAARCPPAIFPMTLCDNLLGQTGDRGARDLLMDALCVDGPADMLFDIDTATDLDRAAALLAAA